MRVVEPAGGLEPPTPCSQDGEHPRPSRRLRGSQASPKGPA
ncbi:MAG: hypothetical protein AVDCRST_MAG35-1975 [uncultured Quadrisphaera sp.]|uniref:Uncharacterized protein n=1 Tax=uncultured Quadrisphaera sp. TaxID=904978 RepID=A0A6J4PVJ4_9ACTN|nr:MAG: hypothetical protein AVDCRST_MAG35-1975 [uncultured Quadrisphaera sp.]